MKTNLCASNVLLLAALFFCASPVRAEQAGNEKEEKLQKLLDAGGKLMQTLRPDEKMDKSFYLQVQYDDKPCGYDIQTLVARKAEKDFVYDYKQELTFRNMDGSHMSLKIEAVLSQFFQPQEIHINQTQRQPKDSKAAAHSIDVSVKFGEKTIEITKVMDGEKKPAESHPAIDSSFIFGTEMLMRLVDAKEASEFALPEFNPQSGKMEYALFRRVAAPSGAFSLRAIRGDQKVEDYYNYDAKGVMFESGKANPPFSEKNASKDFIEALKPIIDK